MTKIRKINKVWQSKPTVEGAGVRLHRAFGYSQVPHFDPFLLLDDFRGDDPADYLIPRCSLMTIYGMLFFGRRKACEPQTPCRKALMRICLWS